MRAGTFSISDDISILGVYPVYDQLRSQKMINNLKLVIHWVYIYGFLGISVETDHFI